jgi:hypothetical protein
MKMLKVFTKTYATNSCMSREIQQITGLRASLEKACETNTVGHEEL